MFVVCPHILEARRCACATGIGTEQCRQAMSQRARPQRAAQLWPVGQGRAGHRRVQQQSARGGCSSGGSGRTSMSGPSGLPAIARRCVAVPIRFMAFRRRSLACAGMHRHRRLAAASCLRLPSPPAVSVRTGRQLSAWRADDNTCVAAGGRLQRHSLRPLPRESPPRFLATDPGRPRPLTAPESHHRTFGGGGGIGIPGGFMGRLRLPHAGNTSPGASAGVSKVRGRKALGRARIRGDRLTTTPNAMAHGRGADCGRAWTVRQATARARRACGEWRAPGGRVVVDGRSAASSEDSGRCMGGRGCGVWQGEAHMQTVQSKIPVK